MNIASMIMKIVNFQEYVADSGFLRDVQEFIKTIAEAHNKQNLLLLKDVTENALEHLRVVEESDVPGDIDSLLPKEDIQKFAPHPHIQILTELLDDTEVDTDNYHSRLHKALKTLKEQLESNQTALTDLYNVLLPFYERDKEISEKAVMSFVFKDVGTISNLKQFTKTLHRWNRALYVYHQLVTSEKPKDVELVNIQGGSFEVLVNVDLNIAVNLTEIVKYALAIFGGYLLYKERAKPITETFFGNKKLLAMEGKKEAMMLDNIGETVRTELKKQHEALLKKDNKINKESVNKKIDEVAGVLVEHIIKGNDIKLLADFDPNNEEEKDSHQLLEDVKQASLKVRNRIKMLTEDDVKLLIDKYSIKEKEEE